MSFRISESEITIHMPNLNARMEKLSYAKMEHLFLVLYSFVEFVKYVYLLSRGHLKNTIIREKKG